MKWTLLILWAVIGLAIFEVTASQAALVTFGERLAGAAPSLVLMFCIPVILVVVIWLTWLYRKRIVPRFLWIAPVVCVLAALSPLLFATETRSRESTRIVNAIALAAAGKQLTGERAFRVDGDVPYCTGVAGLLSLNHSMPMYREYALWLECQNSSIREIRLVRRGDSLVILSAFSPSADHINAFSDRKKNAISVPPRS